MPFLSGFGPGELIVVLVIALTCALPVIVVVLLAREVRARDRSAGSWAPPPADPRAILAERLARGEITPAEFETAMRALGYGEPRA